MKLATILLCLLCASPLFAAGNVSDASRTNAVVEIETEGVVIANVPDLVDSQGFTIRSQETISYVVNKTMVVPDVGDIVRIRGFIRTDNFLGDIFQANRVFVSGKTTPEKALPITPNELNGDKYLYRQIELSGMMTDAFLDDIDPAWTILVFRTGANVFYAMIHSHTLKPEVATRRFAGAEVRIRGICVPHIGHRAFLNHHVALHTLRHIQILKPANEVPLSAPRLEAYWRLSPESLNGKSYRTVVGTVVANWQGSHCLLKTDDSDMITLDLAPDETLPPVGQHVIVAGFPTTDLLRVILTFARCKPDGGTPAQSDTPTDTTPGQILLDAGGKRCVNARAFNCRAIGLRGIVRTLPRRGLTGDRMILECDSFSVPIDISEQPSLISTLEIGSEISVAGICLMETDAWHPDAPIPRIRGFVLIVRTPDDVIILSRPSWWTVNRLFTVVVALLAAIVCILIWNRILGQIIAHRSRALAKEQIAHSSSLLKIGERTRLAVELHDVLSQNLAGVACQVAAVRNNIDTEPDMAKNRLQTAERMLMSCRTELRNCLFDLRSDTLEEPDFETAIRTTLNQIETDAKISIRFGVPRSRLLDSTAHGILCIIRELTANAVRHGNADKILIAGSIEDTLLRFSVHDNGTGFTPNACNGPNTGHFGLAGIHDRIRNFGGSFTISSDTTGTRAVVTIPLHKSTQIANKA